MLTACYSCSNTSVATLRNRSGCDQGFEVFDVQQFEQAEGANGEGGDSACVAAS